MKQSRYAKAWACITSAWLQSHYRSSVHIVIVFFYFFVRQKPFPVLLYLCRCSNMRLLLQHWYYLWIWVIAGIMWMKRLSFPFWARTFEQDSQVWQTLRVSCVLAFVSNTSRKSKETTASDFSASFALLLCNLTWHMALNILFLLSTCLLVASYGSISLYFLPIRQHCISLLMITYGTSPATAFRCHKAVSLMPKYCWPLPQWLELA